MKKNNFDLEYEASSLFNKMRENNIPCIILAGMETSVTGVSANSEEIMSLLTYMCDNHPETTALIKLFAGNIDEVEKMLAKRRSEAKTIIPLATRL